MQGNIEQSRIQSFGSLEFISRQVVEGFITGLHRVRFTGFLWNLQSIGSIMLESL